MRSAAFVTVSLLRRLGGAVAAICRDGRKQLHSVVASYARIRAEYVDLSRGLVASQGFVRVGPVQLKALRPEL